jgi:hypothetical protein
MPGKNLPEQIQHVHAYGPTTPATAAPDYISLKHVDSVEIVLQVLNGATVTGSAVTINQATAVAGTSAKALAFTTYYSCADPANTAVFTKATAASNTFTTANTNAATLIYRIPVDPSSLDRANSFDCIQVGLANATNAVVSAHYNVVNKYGGNAATVASVIAD